MKNSKFIYIIIVTLILILCGCGKKSADLDAQFETGSGDYVARISISDYGQITFRIFSDAAYDAVQKFISDANSGLYNGTCINTVIEDYCLIMNSTSAEDSARFELSQSSDKYRPYRGALCFSDIADGIAPGKVMIINSDTDFLNDLSSLLEYKQVTLAEYLSQAYGVSLSEEELSAYQNYGGAPWLYGHTVVFGQVYEGFDVLDRINSAVTSEDSQYKPEEDIVIESIEIIQQ